jgi:hypothetical protein
VYGTDFFGLTHPTIQNLIQYCPGAKKCQGYRWQKFEISKDGAQHQETQLTVNVEIFQRSQAYTDGGSFIDSFLTHIFYRLSYFLLQPLQISRSVKRVLAVCEIF